MQSRKRRGFEPHSMQVAYNIIYIICCKKRFRIDVEGKVYCYAPGVILISLVMILAYIRLGTKRSHVYFIGYGFYELGMEGCLASHDLGRGELTPSVGA